MPLAYTRCTARFLSCWIPLLPLAMWESFGEWWNHLTVVPATTLMAVVFFSVEELAWQLKELFFILPLNMLCDLVFRGAVWSCFCFSPPTC